MPDLFKGNPWKTENFPPPDFKVLLDMLDEIDHQANTTVNNMITDLSVSSKVFLVGFCWGAKICVNAGYADSKVSGIAVVHPSFLTEEMGAKLTVPLHVQCASDDPDLTSFFNNVKSQTIGEKSSYKIVLNCLWEKYFKPIYSLV